MRSRSTICQGWEADDHSAALGALQRSCAALEERADDEPLDIAALGGRVGDWRTVCAAAAGLEGADKAREFFEAHFAPYEARNGAEAKGLFTGYFEPELRGARQADGRYAVPLYARPDDLVTVDLGLFRSALVGERVAGRVADGALEPYATRADIDGGALAAQGLELVWVDDPIDAFFLHIQGSGRIVFEDGTTRRLAYAATNGHSYVAIGRRLVDLDALSREDVSMQTIRDWLTANPERASEVMQENASYVFFRWLEEGQATDGPVGTQKRGAHRRALARGGPPLRTDDRAGLAGERGARPRSRQGGSPAQAPHGGAGLGWRDPRPGAGRRVFWGTGAEAGAVAGRMKHAGRYWLLLPRGLDVSAHLD